MKDAKFLIALAALCVGLLIWRLKSNSAEKVSEQSTTAQLEADQNLQTNNADEEKIKPSSLPPRPKVPTQKAEVIKDQLKNFSFKVDTHLPQEQQEEQAINNYARAMYLFSTSDQKPEHLVQKLAEAGLKPLVVQDFNDVTGKMIVVRTDETLPGTRYFHAQYFEDENRQPFLQHMSVEFRPGETSFAQAVAAIDKQFPKNTGAAKSCGTDFVAWPYGDMTKWCKRLDKNDIENDDPTRAYGKEDDGTIRCAIELNPHPQEDVCGE